MCKGFSLIELLISLIIISVIVAVFTPTMTGRLKNKSITISPQEAKTDCTKFDPDGRCLMCDSKKCTLCISSMNVPDGKFVDPAQSCDLQNCTFFSAKCTRCIKEGCLECASGYTLKDGVCKPCTSLFANCLNCTDSVCHSCRGGYELSNDSKSCINPCEKYNAALIVAEGKKFCMKKRNVGDIGGPSARGDCRGGRTASNCTLKQGLDYNPCNRTVCTWQAAKKSCEAIGWKLPNEGHRAALNKVLSSINVGSDGLQLCALSGNVSSVCNTNSDCNMGGNDNCYPALFWSDNGTEYPDGMFELTYPLESNGGWIGKRNFYTSWLMSVRCVFDLL